MRVKNVRQRKLPDVLLFQGPSKVLQICCGNVLFQIVPGKIMVCEGRDMGSGLNATVNFSGAAAGSEKRTAFSIVVRQFALNFGNGLAVVFGSAVGMIRTLRLSLGHLNHLANSFPPFGKRYSLGKKPV